MPDGFCEGPVVVPEKPKVRNDEVHLSGVR